MPLIFHFPHLRNVISIHTEYWHTRDIFTINFINLVSYKKDKSIIISLEFGMMSSAFSLFLQPLIIKSIPIVKKTIFFARYVHVMVQHTLKKSLPFNTPFDHIYDTF